MRFKVERTGSDSRFLSSGRKRIGGEGRPGARDATLETLAGWGAKEMQPPT